MSHPVPTADGPNISSLFFERLTDDHGDLIHTLSELAEQIQEQNLQGVFEVLDAIDSQVKGMRNVAIIFDGYLDKHEQLTKYLKTNPEEGT